MSLVACGAEARVPWAPTCTILGTEFMDGALHSAMASEATSPNAPHFAPFRWVATDTYAISETWLHTSRGPVMVRARAHPARRPAFGDLDGSGWSITALDVGRLRVKMGDWSWSAPFARGSANSGNERDDGAAGAVTVPQLMRVGTANHQIFACAGGRSADNAARTTHLLEIKPPTSSVATSGSKVFIQDLLSGDDRFVPNTPGPLTGPANPPTPTITQRPGNPVREGSVECAMTQRDDDVTTRELHMLTISRGLLYHSVASNYSLATTGSGFTFHRFNTVSPWGEVGQALGVTFGTTVDATIVASRPTAISVFFVAESGGRYRLHHTFRHANGSWRPADDVLALNKHTPNGTTSPFKVGAGVCPVFGQLQDSELNYVMWDALKLTHVGRVVQGYPPMSRIHIGGASDPSLMRGLQLGITSRPIRLSP